MPKVCNDNCVYLIYSGIPSAYSEKTLDKIMGFYFFALVDGIVQEKVKRIYVEISIANEMTIPLFNKVNNKNGYSSIIIKKPEEIM